MNGQLFGIALLILAGWLLRVGRELYLAERRIPLRETLRRAMEHENGSIDVVRAR